ncbi:polysaccharide deacetylase family protein [Microbacter margulisiae]|uniref:Peptidoglycan/xylan/chitin deacetylase (PgdA/CDA1 family) n=1 Tax=Microbacter margulisiae TaxID=1350067 RepID=A0A7W5H2V9_9PORP|nr:polysaccharide deacetylase family protein [Microbacter margulisiae]MBB3187851.1 peptidoglycan/xylan/chitin deacetylase (PgdA/CDA1 family) [Microbacter margulisiae]
MNKIILFISAILLTFVVTSCNHAAQHRSTKSPANDSSLSSGEPRNTPAQICAKPDVPVLCFHHIADNIKSVYAVTPATFEADMKMLADSGYHSVSPDQLYDYLVYNKPLPAKPVMITFDDARAEQATVAEPILKKYGFRGVFFIMTITYNKKNYMTTEQIAQLAKDGNTIGLHSWDHQMVTKYKDAADWQKEVVAPKAKLEKIVGMPVKYWAYPDGIYNHTSTVELSKYFKLSFSLGTKKDTLEPLQTVPRMIVPGWTPRGLLNAMHRTFEKRN